LAFGVLGSGKSHLEKTWADFPNLNASSDGDQTVMNDYAGYLLRSKVATSNEGGVACGAGVIDSPSLVD
jgi:hypothetical protein